MHGLCISKGERFDFSPACRADSTSPGRQALGHEITVNSGPVGTRSMIGFLAGIKPFCEPANDPYRVGDSRVFAFPGLAPWADRTTLTGSKRKQIVSSTSDTNRYSKTPLLNNLPRATLAAPYVYTFILPLRHATI